MDFIPGGDDGIQFCDPLNPRVIAVAAKSQAVKIALTPASRLSAGSATATLVRLSLRTASGKPVGEEDLAPSPGGSLRIFILSEDLTDFKTARPLAGETPGDWTFDFRPKEAGLYRVFADMTPVATGRELYAYSDLGVEGAGRSAGNAPSQTGGTDVPDAARPPRRPLPSRNAKSARNSSRLPTPPAPPSRFSAEAESDGYRFALFPVSPPAYAHQVIALNLRIARPDGGAVLLVPFQGAFVHMEIFDESRSGFLTLSPSLGGTRAPPDPFHPVFGFSASIPDPGRYVAWVRVDIAGKETAVPLSLEVLP
jgi:hypothetical protein